MNLRCFALCLAAVLALGTFSPAGAAYPDRPITLIANYSAGGGADLSARALAKKAEKFLGQPIAVVNKAGAAGTIGVGALAASRPDGYTIGVTTSGTLTMGPHIYDLPYDPFKSFDFIMGYGRYMYGPCVRSDSPFKTLKDLVAYAKANPGKIKFSHIGLASPNHFSMMLLAKAENIQWEPVIFKETTAAVTACLGGHVDVVSQNPGDVVPYIKAGRLRLLVWNSGSSLPESFDVPTAAHMGLRLVWGLVVEQYGGSFRLGSEAGGTQAEVSLGVDSLVP